MRLIWKAHDTRFNPIIAFLGAALTLWGGMVLYGCGISRPWPFWVLRLLAADILAAGAIILVREFQLWKKDSK